MKDNFPEFARDFKSLSELHVRLELTGLEAWVLFAQLQLALRHPGNTGPGATIAREIASAIQGHIAVTPTLAQVAERGWDERYDKPVS